MGSFGHRATGRVPIYRARGRTALLALTLILMLVVTLLTLISLVNRPATIMSSVACNAKQSGEFLVDTLQITNKCPKLLVFSKTAGFRHASIPAAKMALEKLAAEHNVAADFTEDATAFTDANLAQYSAVVFLLTTGDVLDDSQQLAFERYIRAGHGWVGVHSASDTEYDWAWYGGLVGAYFRDHPAVQSATLDVAEPRNGLPARWTRTDEWYNFRSNPRASVHVLATIDESTYDGGGMGTDHPIAWWHEYDGGRAWYTAGGHTDEAWSEPLFLAHVLTGIQYALGMPGAAAAK